MKVAGKTALVTGGAVRVGKAIALELARRGADVAITYRSSAGEAEKTVEELRGVGAQAVAFRCDQRDPEQVTAALAQVEAELGPVAVLVNNAAIFRRTPVQTATLEDWNELLEVNLRGPWLFAQAAGNGMKARGEGVILNMVDVAVEKPYVGYLPYCASKAGLVSLTLGLARALAPEVRVNGIAPGTVLWPDDYPQEQKDVILKRTPLGREGTPEDIARAVGYLVEDAPFVTGAILPVDGGFRLG